MSLHNEDKISNPLNVGNRVRSRHPSSHPPRPIVRDRNLRRESRKNIRSSPASASVGQNLRVDGVDDGGAVGKWCAGRAIEGDSHDHLLAAQQRVADELARAQSDGGVRIGHLRGWMASLSCEVDDQDRRLWWLVFFYAVGDFWRAARNWVELENSGPVSGNWVRSPNELWPGP